MSSTRVQMIRGQSEESEEDLFRSNFSSSDSGRVKIAGGADSHVGLATAKYDATRNGKSDPKTSPTKEKSLTDKIPNQVCTTANNKTNPPTSALSEKAMIAGATRSGSKLQRTFSEQITNSGNNIPRTSHVTRTEFSAHPTSYISSPEYVDTGDDEDEDAFIEINVSDPNKVGEGMSSFLMYQVTTKTNLRYFKKSQFTVSRRFSDFLGLHEKLSEKYLSRGRIIPPAPEKSLVATTKVKMSSEGSLSAEQSDSYQNEFIKRRRHALERFINRVANHPVLRKDQAFVEFLETVRELPRATSTSALSSASVFKLLGRVGDTVNKITYKMEETDPWYEDKIQQIDALESHLKKLYSLIESLVACRHEVAVATGALSQSMSVLASVEEAHSLATALSRLARVEEKVETVHHHQTEIDHLYLFELVKDYVALVAAVKDVLNERFKAFQNWQHAQAMLLKKKEQRSRLEMGGRVDKIPTANEEVGEWEKRLVEYQDNFNKISEVIKVEIELFERYRIKDFKVAIIQYLEGLMTCQVEMVKHWEEFLPDVKTILF